MLEEVTQPMRDNLKKMLKKRKEKNEKCETCHFHDGVFCRKNAPIPLLTFRDVMHKEGWRPTAWWPETGPEEWCGEYKKRSEN